MTHTLARALIGSLRRLRRFPGTTLLMVGTIGLAMAAAIAVFSVLHAIALRDVSAPDPHRLATVSMTDGRSGQPVPIFAPTFDAFRQQQASFASLSMYASGLFRVAARGTMADVSGEGVSGGYFDVMRIAVHRGRGLGPADGATAASGAAAVVIGDGLWRRVFGADPEVVGEVIEIDGRAATIVGVAASNSGLEPDNGVELFLPIEVARANPLVPGPVGARYLVGRLASGVTLPQARAEVAGRWPAIVAETAAAWPPSAREAAPSVVVSVESAARGYSTMRTQFAATYSALLAVVAALLIVATVNMASLMAATLIARRQEFAVCRALGASHWRLAAQPVVDAVVTALAGLIIAVPLAWWIVKVLTAAQTVARAAPLARTLTPDGTVIAVALVATLTIGLTIGLACGRLTRVPSDPELLRGRGTAQGTGRGTRLLIGAQVGLSLVLVVGAGLFQGSLQGLRANGGDLPQRRMVWTRLAVTPGDRGPAFDREYFRQLNERLSAVPGAGPSVFSTLFPAYIGFVGALPQTRYSAAGSAPGTSPRAALAELVSPAFFRTYGIVLLQGRDFTWDDDADAPLVAVLSRSMAAAVLGGEPPIGRRLHAETGGSGLDLTVVGLVEDAPIGSLREPHVPVVYRPMLQDLARARTPLVHLPIIGDPSTVRRGYVEAVDALRRHFVRGLFTLDEWTRFALLQERLLAGFAIAAAALAAVLGLVGLVGLVARAIVARRREIGLRVALGATPATVAALMVREAQWTVVAGIAVGVPAALAAARLVESRLYAVDPADPAIVAAAAAAVLLAGVAAAAVTARRATHLNPAVALKEE